MSAVDLPPGLGLAGRAEGAFRAPARARRLATAALAVDIAAGAVTWGLVAHHPFHRHASTQVVLPVALCAMALVGFAVRSARLAVTRDGVRWGWRAFGFQQSAARIACAHAFADGIALEARRGSRWFLAARDWDRFDALVRAVKRAELPLAEHAGPAPLRQRLQSYGRFLDALLALSMLASLAVMLWAA